MKVILLISFLLSSAAFASGSEIKGCILITARNYHDDPCDGGSYVVAWLKAAKAAGIITQHSGCEDVGRFYMGRYKVVFANEDAVQLAIASQRAFEQEDFTSASIGAPGTVGFSYCY